ncbi:DUF378 domain-containing protein [Saliterribacillus persicus]|uniref:DUF378 domain-containing protein n=1 Tax=Saliterribacillus persicus TaxID=930114 RepID=A0A368Y4N5_9BACI|nr:DUF378 domain-containing protein [Saliterribacillus persicus]RCW73184.1 hypothetical protein DFR57_104182 [Saliterribacillus persicus]
MSTISRIALVLVIIGAINWGLIGLFQFDLVAALFGGQDGALARIVYSLVGLSGLWCIGLLFSDLQENNEEPSNAGRPKNMAYSTEFSEEIDDSGAIEEEVEPSRPQE